METSRNGTRRRVGLFAGMLAALLAVATAGAESTQIVQSITGGGQPTIMVESANLTPASYSPDEQSSPGQLSYLIDAETGASDGWSVNVQSSDLAYSGEHGGTDIPAANLAVLVAAAPERISGDAVDGSGGPFVPADGAAGALDQPRTVLVATPGHGHGSYRQNLTLELTIPGDSKVGDYAGTLTFTTSAGP